MNPSCENTIFACVAAWSDWREKIDVFYRSAQKQGIRLEILDKECSWQGYYRHKIVNLRNWILAIREKRPDIKYVVFTDSRDVVYIKPAETLLDNLRMFDDEKVLFMANQMHPWPMRIKWLSEKIVRKFGPDGFANSGCCAGRIDTYLKLLDECVSLHERLLTGQISGSGDERNIFLKMQRSYLDSDQFHIQTLQVLRAELISVDTGRKVFAGFDGGYPLLKTAPERGSNGIMPLGDAGILHSPWMFSRENRSADAIDEWKKWAKDEGIVD